MPRIPAWAAEHGSIDRNVRTDSSRLPRLRISAAGSSFFSHATSVEEEQPVPAPVDSTEVPIPTKALMKSIHNPKHVPEFTDGFPISAPSSSPKPHHCEGWRNGVHGNFHGLEDSSFRHVESSFRHRPSASEWYERTSTHVIGMIVLMFLAIIFVEAYEKFQSCSKHSRRRGSRQSRRRGTKKGSELVDEKKQWEQKALLDESDDDDDDENHKDFWSV